MFDSKAYNRAYYRRNSDKKKAAARQWVFDNPERAKERARLWYLKNKIKVLARHKQRRSAIREVNKIWRDNNTEHLREYDRRYRKENVSIVRAIYQRRYARHRNQILACNRQYRTNHPQAHRLANVKRRARHVNAVGTFSVSDWEKIKAIFDFTCPMCRKSEPEIKLTIDHKIPLFIGGTNWPDNIQPLCDSCNKSKQTKVWFAHCPVDKSALPIPFARFPQPGQKLQP